MSKPRVALVCDWLTTVGGAESVLLALHELYPDAPIYTSKYDKKGIDWFQDADVRTGWLQIFPNSLRRLIGPLRQFYFSHLDLSNYDLVISVTGAEAKSVRTKSRKTEQAEQTRQTDQAKQVNRTKQVRSSGHHCVHLCYCHVPTQYYWGLYDDYQKNPGFGILNPLVHLGLKLFIGPLRKSDLKASARPDQFITISTYAASLIKKYYHRDATIIYPPANLERFSTKAQKFSTIKNNKNGKSQAKNKTNYITTSRQVNWKRLDICVKACLETGDELTLIGDGPEHENLVRLANGAPNIHFLPTMPQAEVAKYLRESDVFLFPSLEPFGLAPIEAMAAGLPVIAYGKGGARDYIIPGKNGVFFDEQTPHSLIGAMRDSQKINYSVAKIQKSVEPFDKSIFKKNIQEKIDEALR